MEENATRLKPEMLKDKKRTKCVFFFFYFHCRIFFYFVFAFYILSFFFCSNCRYSFGAGRHFERVDEERRRYPVCLQLQTLTLPANDANDANWANHGFICVCVSVKEEVCLRGACESIIIRAANANEPTLWREPPGKGSTPANSLADLRSPWLECVWWNFQGFSLQKNVIFLFIFFAKWDKH